MKRILSFLLVILSLTGCANSREDIAQMLSLRSKIESAKECTFDTAITADYADKVYTFSMQCRVDESGNLSFTVTEPESIQGISGTVTATGGDIRFNNEVLAFPLLVDGVISPVTTPWLLLHVLKSGYIHSCSKTSEGFAIRLDDTLEGENLQVQLWADHNCIPGSAEFIHKGKRILSVTVTNFVIM